MTVKEVLLSVVNYPVPESTIGNIVDARKLVLETVVNTEIRESDAFKLASADVFRWTSFAPNVVQGGIAYSILYSDRKEMREQANLVYKELGDSLYKPGIRQIFTFQGDDV